MGESDVITERQLSVLVFICLLSPLLRTVPDMPVLFAGRAAWLSPLAALPLAVIVLKVIDALVGDAPPGAGLAEMSLGALGSVGGRVFCAALALWLSFYAGSVSRSASERLLSAVYPDGSGGILILIMTALAAAASLGTAKALTRTAELFLPLIASVLAVILLAAATDVETDYLLPVTWGDGGNIALGALPVFDVMGLHVYFLLMRGRVRADRPSRRFPFLAATALTALAVTAVTLGIVSDRLALRLQNAFFVVIRNIELLGVVERVESVLVAVWILTDYVMLAALIFMASDIWRVVFRAKRRGLFVWASAATAAVCAFLIAPDAFALTKWTDFIIPLVNMTVTTLAVPVVLAVYRRRRRG